MSRYQRWHDQIIERARTRKPLGCYKESHHIIPRSLGGLDGTENLVDLTYREHFLVHWLLTRVTAGSARRKMQRALFAMTLRCSDERRPCAWQFTIAKNAVQDLEVDPIAEAIWREKFRRARILAARERRRLRERRIRKERPEERIVNQNAVRERVKGVSIRDAAELNKLSDLFLRHTGHFRIRDGAAKALKPREPNPRAIKIAKNKARKHLRSLGIKLKAEC